MTSPARNVIGLVTDDTAKAADEERGNPSHGRSHYLEDTLPKDLTKKIMEKDFWKDPNKTVVLGN